MRFMVAKPRPESMMRYMGKERERPKKIGFGIGGVKGEPNWGLLLFFGARLSKADTGKE
jgi:hypothetical protein